MARRPLSRCAVAASMLARNRQLCVADSAMDDGGLSRHWTAPNRRWSGSSARWRAASPRPAATRSLRAKVREVVEELDELIREAAV